MGGKRRRLNAQVLTPQLNAKKNVSNQGSVLAPPSTPMWVRDLSRQHVALEEVVRDAGPSRDTSQASVAKAIKIASNYPKFQQNGGEVPEELSCSFIGIKGVRGK